MNAKRGNLASAHKVGDEVTLDATERKVFVIASFVSACICFGPRQWVSGGILVVMSVSLAIWDMRVSKREAAEAKAKAPPTTSPENS